MRARCLSLESREWTRANQKFREQHGTSNEVSESSETCEQTRRIKVQNRDSTLARERTAYDGKSESNGGHSLYFCHHFLSFRILVCLWYEHITLNLLQLPSKQRKKAFFFVCSIQNGVYRFAYVSFVRSQCSFCRLSFWRSFTIALLYALLSGAVAVASTVCVCLCVCVYYI